MRGGSFLQETRAHRVRFGAGVSAHLPEEVEALGARRVLLISTPRGGEEAGDLAEALGGALAATFHEARLHVPRAVADRAVATAREAGADLLVAVGGGSPIGVAKMVALELGLPIVAIPTTYSGSEMTRVWGVSDEGGKTTGEDERVAPRVVLYDPARTLELPTETSVRSGVNAMAHAVEALYAPKISPLSNLVAEEGIRVMAEALPVVVREPEALGARGGALLGAHLCGWALDQTSMGLHHKLAHVLGGTFDLPHSLVHAILLPRVVAFNARAAPGAMARVARALGRQGDGLTEAADGLTEAADGLRALNESLGITETLRDLGLGPAELDRAAELATQVRYPNPRPADRADIRRVLQAAWDGDLPEG